MENSTSEGATTDKINLREHLEHPAPEDDTWGYDWCLTTEAVLALIDAVEAAQAHWHSDPRAAEGGTEEDHTLAGIRLAHALNRFQP